MAEKTTRKEELERKQRLAFTLYVANGFEQKVIADITGITEKTISAWKKKAKENGNDWDGERQAAKMGPEQSIRRTMKMYDRLLTQIEQRPEPDNVANSKEGDALNKLAAAAIALQGDVTFFVKSEVGKQFVSYIQNTHGQEKAIDIVNLWHEYLMATA